MYTVDLFQDYFYIHLNAIQKSTTMQMSFMSFFTSDKISGLLKLKGFANDNFDVARFVHFFFDTVGNIVEKGENASIFSFSRNVFKRHLSRDRLKWALRSKGLNNRQALRNSGDRW